MSTFQQYDVSPWLTPVRLVSNANIAGTYVNGPLNNGVAATLTIAASSLTVDSVVANVADRILLTAQSAANQNGIYVVNSIGATVILQRSADFQSIEQMKTGQYVSVGAGTALGGSAFVLVEPLPAILGISNMSWVDASSSADVALPTIANHIATYSNTTGSLAEDPATAISGGNIQAGLSGTAGTVASFPATASKGSLVMAAVANTGNTITTISNDAMGQASVMNIPDPANAIGQFVVGAGATPFVSGNFPQNSGTAGLMVDSGIAVSSLSSAVTQLGALYQVSVTLTPTQMAAAYTAPVNLIAAVSGKVIQVISAAVYTASTGNTAYATGTAPIIQYGATAHGAGTSAVGSGLVAGDITAASSQVRTLGPIASAALTGDTNTGLYFSNATGAYTAGTGTNVTFSFVYQLLTATI